MSDELFAAHNHEPAARWLIKLARAEPMLYHVIRVANDEGWSDVRGHATAACLMAGRVLVLVAENARINMERPAANIIQLTDEQAARLPSVFRSKMSYQTRVYTWMLETFDIEVSTDKPERRQRFLEEALELVQSLGGSRLEVTQLADYVYGRPAGEPRQEVGGVMVTLAGLCVANDIEMDAAGERELERVHQRKEEIRKKHAAKPRHSPLPGPDGRPLTVPDRPPPPPPPPPVPMDVVNRERGTSDLASNVRDAFREAVELRALVREARDLLHRAAGESDGSPGWSDALLRSHEAWEQRALAAAPNT